MLTRRLIAGATAAALLLLEAGAPALAADPGYPTGTFTLDRTTTYLFNPDGSGLGTIPYVVVTRSGITDDETAPGDIAIDLDPRDGSDPFSWNTFCPGDTCVLSFYRTGTFSPQVSLTDGDHHTTTIPLPQVTVLRDGFAPVARLVKPRPRLRHRVSAWRVLHGTASDRGVGVLGVYATVMQKRHGRWYFYAEFNRTWHRGLRTEAATWRKYHSFGERAEKVGLHGWRDPWILGLTRGPLVVRLSASDRNANHLGHVVVARVRLTRR